MSTDVEIAAAAETMARRMVRDLDEYRGGLLSRWTRLELILRRLIIADDAVIDAAVSLAVERGWLLVEGKKICLTEAGRRFAGGSN